MQSGNRGLSVSRQYWRSDIVMLVACGISDQNSLISTLAMSVGKAVKHRSGVCLSVPSGQLQRSQRIYVSAPLSDG